MGKLHSLAKLDSLGLNTPELIVTIGQFDPDKAVTWESTLARLKKENARQKVSIRTERDGEVLCPHYPNVTLGESDKRVRDLYRQGYATHIFRGIDPKDCNLKGTVVGLRQDKAYVITVEYTVGRGTVRDNEVGNVKTFASEESRFRKELEQEPEEIRSVLEEIIETYQDNMEAGDILEWSAYNKPVGKLNDSLIYWEIRRWK